MIKHVIFTDQALAKALCYDLASTLTQAQRAAGTTIYSIVTTHPDGTPFAVAVDDSHADALAVLGNNDVLVDLDDTWFPVDPALVVQ